ncbi:MAG TPA: hypothetical protein VN416_01610 [Desulfomonilia bacterium]|jgi:hypothetical protein|nr:hypothetical protein [Thermodesulfobacteriota bacterium]HWR67695.1 hypothetical protein [Desulfomonilia bacterium]
MEVKSIFMNLIMRTYEKQHAMNAGTVRGEADKYEGDHTADTVTISERAGKRLFRDVMENSLQKGLREVIVDEN